MRYTLLFVFLLTSTISQALIIHPYAGLSFTKEKVYGKYTGSGSNYIVGLRLDHQFLGGIQLGIGADVQKMKYSVEAATISGGKSSFDVTAGNPAYSFYFHAGYRIRISHFSIIPGLSMGGCYAKSQEKVYNNIIAYPDNAGYLLGGNLGLEYGFKRLAIHAEFMPRYYKETFIKDASSSLELMNYPATLGLTIKL